MKFVVCYIDKQKELLDVEASTAKLAAFEFLAQRPRRDASQITVESRPSRPHSQPSIVHYRACDLIDAPVPPDDVGPEDLVLRIQPTRDGTYYTVSGRLEALRIMATRLLHHIDESPSHPSSPAQKQLYGVPVTPADNSRLLHGLSFEAEPDISRHWRNQRGVSGFWGNYGSMLIHLGVFVLACIGLWTIVRWIL